MTDPQDPQAHDEYDEDDGPPPPPPTPFDHPLFLPALFFAGCIWFGYDGFLTTDEEMLEHQTFNQIGFVLLVIGFAYYGYTGYHEWREDREHAEREGTGE